MTSYLTCFAGFTLLLVCKELSRLVMLRALPPLYFFFPLRLRRMWQPPIHNLYDPEQIPNKVSSHTCTSVCGGLQGRPPRSVFSL